MKVTHVVVDGSNIATEGRDAPSLAQLDEAVRAFLEEYSPDFVTVVVDATFPNRIDRKERQTYEDAVNANELVTPPAGAIGRGDAFILQIARRANAAILSNDSFQEFHGEYPWLFEKGRLIGGKPVPHVGWVFMDRAPVRGPTSRRAVSEARKQAKSADRAVSRSKGSDDGESKTPRKRRSRAKVITSGTGTSTEAAATATDVASVAAAAAELSDDGRSGGSGRSGKGPDPYNEALPFIDFVAQHPVGSEVDAVIEKFSSHGAYVMVGEARGYLPLRNLADPAPRSAKEVLRVGDEGRFVVVAIDPPRRGIDLAVPGVVEVSAPEPVEAAADGDDASVPGPAAEAAVAAEVSARRAATKKSAGARAGARKQAPAPAAPAEVTDEDAPAPTTEAPARAKAARKRAASKKAATAPATDVQAGDAGVASADTAADGTAPDAAAPSPVAKKSGTRKATAKKAPAKATTAKKAATKRSTVKKSTAKKTTAKKATAKKAPARKATASVEPPAPASEPQASDAGGVGDHAEQPAGADPTTTTVEKAAAKKAAAKKVAARKTPTKRAAKKTAAKKSPARKAATSTAAAAKKVAARKADSDADLASPPPSDPPANGDAPVDPVVPLDAAG